MGANIVQFRVIQKSGLENFECAFIKTAYRFLRMYCSRGNLAQFDYSFKHRAGLTATSKYEIFLTSSVMVLLSRDKHCLTWLHVLKNVYLKF